MKIKIAIIILIEIVLICVSTMSIATWGIGGGLAAELPTYDPPTDSMTLPSSYPADKSSPNVPKGDTVTENNITVTRYSSISGIAFEDYQQICEISNNNGNLINNTFINNFTNQNKLKTKRFSTNSTKDSNEKGIENVVVELLKGDNAVATLLTNTDGSFSFDDIGNTYGPGQYKLRFYYGLVNSTDYLPDENSSEYILPQINNLDSNGNPYEKIKNIIKYNGQDYTATQVGNKYYGYDSFTKKILESGKAYSQVFLLIDCSGSVAEDNEKVFKLEIEAAKETVKNLLSSNEENDNIAIGIVGFYNDKVIIKQLTNVENDLLERLDNITLDPATATQDPSIEIIAVNNFMNWDKKPYGTNIAYAIEETEKLFITDTDNPDNSNRTIVLLSDGYPSAHNSVEQLYSNDEDSVIYDKFMRVTEETNKSIQTIVDKGVKLISVIAEPEKSDTVTRELVDRTFKNIDGNYIGNYKEISLTDEEIYKQYIGSDIPQIVKEGQQEGDIVDEPTEEGIFNEMERLASNTGDNEERRKIVNKNFSVVNNEKANWLNIADKLKGTIEDMNIVSTYYNSNSVGGQVAYKDYIKELTSKSFMYSESNDYQINVVAETEDAVIVNNGNGSQTYKREDYDNIFVNNVNYTSENLALEKRTEFKLKLEKKITGFRVTLSDGTILKEEIQNDFKNVYDTNMLSVPIVMDEEIMHGAKLELEYTIRITNMSGTNIQTGKEISIIDYINSEGSNLQYDLDTKLLSNPEYTNSYYLWKTTTKQELENNKSVNKDVIESLSDSEEYLIANYNINDYNNSYNSATDTYTYPVNPIISKNGYIDIKLVGTTTLTAGLETDDLTYSNTAEILTYSNLMGRRIDYEMNKEEVENGIDEYIKFLSDIPDKSVIPGNYKIGDEHEEDSYTSISLTIIPPLGEKTKQCIIPISLGIVFVVGLLFIKKKVLK